MGGVPFNYLFFSMQSSLLDLLQFMISFFDSTPQLINLLLRLLQIAKFACRNSQLACWQIVKACSVNELASQFVNTSVVYLIISNFSISVRSCQVASHVQEGYLTKQRRLTAETSSWVRNVWPENAVMLVFSRGRIPTGMETWLFLFINTASG